MTKNEKAAAASATAFASAIAPVLAPQSSTSSRVVEKKTESEIRLIETQAEMLKNRDTRDAAMSALDIRQREMDLKSKRVKLLQDTINSPAFQGFSDSQKETINQNLVDELMK